MRNLTAIVALLGIWTISLNAQDMFKARQLTFDTAQQGFPTWAPDGNSIAFTRGRSGNCDIWVMDMNIEEVNKELQALKE